MNPEREDSDSVEQRLLDQYLEVTQLAGALAHEIKNPLSVIRMNMDLVAEDLVADEVAQAGDHGARRLLQKVNVVRSQCHRLQTLLDDFLKFVRISTLDLKAGSLNEQLQRVLDFIAPKARELGIEVNDYLDADLPTILMDAPRLYAALLNLVLNAVQAMPDGGTLVIRTRLTPAGVAADLIDDGSGMGQDTALHMFEPFYTTKEDGSGLGLPIARRIIEAHGGRIAVQSEVGHGTQFTLEFPMPARITDKGMTNDELMTNDGIPKDEGMTKHE